MKRFTGAWSLIAALGILFGTCTDKGVEPLKNSPPRFRMAFTDTSVEIGTRLYIALQANDADNDTVRFSGKKIPPQATIDTFSGLFCWEPDSALVGKKDTLVFLAHDGKETDTFELRVSITPMKISNKRYIVPLDFSSIQKAIDAARHGDSIIIKPGIYFENISFKGKAIVVASEYVYTHDSATIATTVIRRQSDAATAPIVEIAKSPDALAPVSLVGLTLTKGRTKYGGGVNVSGCSPVIAHCVIDSNIATGST